MGKCYLYLAGYTEMIQPPLDFFDFSLLLQPFSLRIFCKPPPPPFFCTIIIHPFQCENCRMWETGEKGWLKRELHRLTNLEEYLNKEKVCLLCFLSKERILWERYADSLSRSVIAPALSIPGLVVTRKLLIWAGCS